MAENVFVMTATNRLMSQKLRMMTQTMKKTEDTKYSASMMLYINGAHFFVKIRHVRSENIRYEELTPLAPATITTCNAEK